MRKKRKLPATSRGVTVGTVAAVVAIALSSCCFGSALLLAPAAPEPELAEHQPVAAPTTTTSETSAGDGYYTTVPKFGYLRAASVRNERGALLAAAFLGVRYAAPPIGLLRLMPASAVESGGGGGGDGRFVNATLLPDRVVALVRDQTSFGAECVDLSLAEKGQQLAGSEDCLNLNLFVPLDVVAQTEPSNLSQQQQSQSSNKDNNNSLISYAEKRVAQAQARFQTAVGLQSQGQQQSSATVALQHDARNNLPQLKQLVTGTGGSTTSTPLPVVVLVRGFERASGANKLEFARLARKLKSVVVTFNYRVGLLGFLPLADEQRQQLTQTGRRNHALYDNIGLLHWLRRYASHFNGNAADVTLVSDDSSSNFGALMTQLLTLTPLARGLFNRVVIVDSDQSLSTVAGIGHRSKLAAAFPTLCLRELLAVSSAQTKETRRRLIANLTAFVVQTASSDKRGSIKTTNFNNNDADNLDSNDLQAADVFQALQGAKLAQLAKLEALVLAHKDLARLALLPSLDDSVLFPNLQLANVDGFGAGSKFRGNKRLPTREMFFNATLAKYKVAYIEYLRQLYTNQSNDALDLLRVDTIGAGEKVSFESSSSSTFFSGQQQKQIERKGAKKPQAAIHHQPALWRKEDSGGGELLEAKPEFAISTTITTTTTTMMNEHSRQVASRFYILCNLHNLLQLLLKPTSHSQQQTPTLGAATQSAGGERRPSARRTAISGSDGGAMSSVQLAAEQINGAYDLMIWLKLADGNVEDDASPEKLLEASLRLRQTPSDDDTAAASGDDAFEYPNIVGYLRNITASISIFSAPSPNFAFDWFQFAELHRVANYDLKAGPLSAISQQYNSDKWLNHKEARHSTYVHVAATKRAQNTTTINQQQQTAAGNIDNNESLMATIEHFVRHSSSNNLHISNELMFKSFDVLNHRASFSSNSQNDDGANSEHNKEIISHSSLAVELNLLPFLSTANDLSKFGLQFDIGALISEIPVCLNELERNIEQKQFILLSSPTDSHHTLPNLTDSNADDLDLRCLSSLVFRFRAQLRHSMIKDLEPLLMRLESQLSSSLLSTTITTRNSLRDSSIVTAANQTADFVATDSKQQSQSQQNDQQETTTANEQKTINYINHKTLNGLFANAYESAASEAAIVVGAGLLILIMNIIVVLAVFIRSTRQRRRRQSESHVTQPTCGTRATNHRAMTTNEEDDEYQHGFERGNIKIYPSEQRTLDKKQNLRLANGTLHHTTNHVTKQIKFDLGENHCTHKNNDDGEEDYNDDGRVVCTHQNSTNFFTGRHHHFGSLQTNANYANDQLIDAVAEMHNECGSNIRGNNGDVDYLSNNSQQLINNDNKNIIEQNDVDMLTKQQQVLFITPESLRSLISRETTPILDSRSHHHLNEHQLNQQQQQQDDCQQNEPHSGLAAKSTRQLNHYQCASVNSSCGTQSRSTTASEPKSFDYRCRDNHQMHELGAAEPCGGFNHFVTPVSPDSSTTLSMTPLRMEHPMTLAIEQLSNNSQLQNFFNNNIHDGKCTQHSGSVVELRECQIQVPECMSIVDCDNHLFHHGTVRRKHQSIAAMTGEEGKRSRPVSKPGRYFVIQN